MWSNTVTLEAPASKHFLTKAFTNLGFVLPANSGERSQPIFGLITIFCPFFTKFPIPPRASKALSSITSGSPPITATISGAFSTATVFVERAACRPSKFKDRAALAMTLVFKKSRRFIIVYYIGLYLIYGTVFFIRLLFRTKIMIILICESTPFTK